MCKNQSLIAGRKRYINIFTLPLPVIHIAQKALRLERTLCCLQLTS